MFNQLQREIANRAHSESPYPTGATGFVAKLYSGGNKSADPADASSQMHHEVLLVVIFPTDSDKISDSEAFLFDPWGPKEQIKKFTTEGHHENLVHQVSSHETVQFLVSLSSLAAVFKL